MHFDKVEDFFLLIVCSQKNLFVPFLLELLSKRWNRIFVIHQPSLTFLLWDLCAHFFLLFTNHQCLLSPTFFFLVFHACRFNSGWIVGGEKKRFREIHKGKELENIMQHVQSMAKFDWKDEVIFSRILEEFFCVSTSGVARKMFLCPRERCLFCMGFRRFWDTR